MDSSFLALLAFASSMPRDMSRTFLPHREQTPIPVKPCKQCQKPTSHKKQFCSGDCCRAYRNR